MPVLFALTSTTPDTSGEADGPYRRYGASGHGGGAVVTRDLVNDNANPRATQVAMRNAFLRRATRAGHRPRPHRSIPAAMAARVGRDSSPSSPMATPTSDAREDRRRQGHGHEYARRSHQALTRQERDCPPGMDVHGVVRAAHLNGAPMTDFARSVGTARAGGAVRRGHPPRSGHTIYGQRRRWMTRAEEGDTQW